MAAFTLREQKTALRRLYKEKRSALPEEERQRLDLLISEKLTQTLAYRHASQLLLYASAKGEVDTCMICEKALADGKKVLFPRCEGEHDMTFYYADGFPETGGAFGIPEPKPGKSYCPGVSDLCLVPALSFDKKGFRLGYGKGFYDRFLASFDGTSAGLCYTGFLSEKLPCGKYDLRVDLLITENGIVLPR